MSVGESDSMTRLQTLLLILILNGTAKTKLAILALCCGEIVKNSIWDSDHIDITETNHALVSHSLT